MSVEFAAFVVALIVSLGTVPLVRHLARRIGMVDAPDPTRKLHSGQIALGGGVAILFATLTALGLCVALDRFWGLDQLPWGPHWTALTVGCIAIVALGIIDDRFVLRGRQKLLCQVAIAVGIVLTSDVFESVDVLGIHVNFGIFGFLITVAWLLGAINAINLLDGADGMASTIGAILAAGFAAITALKGASLECAISLALAGALIGFLVYNRPPASIFMGDAGSMMIGLLLGTLALWSSQKETAIMAVAPLVVFAIPLFDSVVAILRRVLTGRSLYDADRAHMHHMLLQRFSHRRTLAIVAMLCTISTTAAVMSVAFNRQWIAPLGAAIALGWLILSRSFGYAEVALLCTRTWYFVESFFTASKKCDSHVRHRTWQMQGSRSWDSIWDSLVEFADKHQLAKVKMDLNIAWMHEGYHGAYQRARLPEKSQQVSLRTPIWANDRIVGRLEVIGGGEATSSHIVLEQLIQRLQDLQPEVERLLAEMSAAHGLAATATTSSEQPQSTPALVEASG